MTFSTLQRALLPATILAGTVFTTVTLPLALTPSENVVLEFRNEPVFSGRLDELAVPYLGFATALSLGVGLTSIAVTGWRQSSKQSAQVEDQISKLQKDLQQKEEQIDQLKFSEHRLADASLNFFLEDSAPQMQPIEATLEVPAMPQPSYQPVNQPISNTGSAVLRYIEQQYAPQPGGVVTSQSKAAVPARQKATTQTRESSPQRWQVEPMGTMHPAGLSDATPAAATPVDQARLRAIAAFPAAQAFTGFQRVTTSPEVPAIAPMPEPVAPSVAVPPTQPQSSVASSNSDQLNELLSQLKQVMTEVERFKTGNLASQGA